MNVGDLTYVCSCCCFFTGVKCFTGIANVLFWLHSLNTPCHQTPCLGHVASFHCFAACFVACCGSQLLNFQATCPRRICFAFFGGFCSFSLVSTTTHERVRLVPRARILKPNCESNRCSLDTHTHRHAAHAPSRRTLKWLLLL